MAEHLIGLGHRRIAMVSGRTWHNDARARPGAWPACRDARSAGLDLPRDAVVEADYSYEAGAEPPESSSSGIPS
ncbi:MAG: hypothetical protein R3E48_09200 [Burkholderiaceae bacterium]